MKQMYNVQISVEASSQQEAEQKVLKLIQLANDYGNKNKAQKKEQCRNENVSHLGTAVGIATIAGLACLSHLIKSSNDDEHNHVETDWDLHEYRWRLERRRRKEMEQRNRIFRLADIKWELPPQLNAKSCSGTTLLVDP